MTLQDQLLQLQGQIPDFWSKRIEEPTFVQTLILAYSYVYGSALRKWQTTENLVSPYTTDAYLVDFYKVIDVHKTVVPSDPTFNGNGYFYFELPLDTFRIDGLSRSLDFAISLNYKIYYDSIQHKSLLEVLATDLLPADRYLYIKEYDIDNGNIAKSWGALFMGINTYVNSTFSLYTSLNDFGYYINAEEYKSYLLNIKAQIINFIRCANSEGSIDALESLISVALNEPYLTTDGIIVNYDSSNTWIESNGTITHYTVPPKLKFQQPNQQILAYEPFCKCQVHIYSWMTDPARFTQTLLWRNGQYLFSLLTLSTNEFPQALYYDKNGLYLDPDSGTYSFDFGIMTSDQVTAPSESYFGPSMAPVNNFSGWTNTGLSNTVYQFFKNVLIAECNTGVIDADWLANILEFYRPLHCKYITPVGGEFG